MSKLLEELKSLLEKGRQNPHGFEDELRFFLDANCEDIIAAIEERDELAQRLNAMMLVCGTTDANKFSSWVDKLKLGAEFDSNEIKIRNETIARLNQRLTTTEQGLANEREVTQLLRRMHDAKSDEYVTMEREYQQRLTAAEKQAEDAELENERLADKAAGLEAKYAALRIAIEHVDLSPCNGGSCAIATNADEHISTILTNSGR